MRRRQKTVSPRRVSKFREKRQKRELCKKILNYKERNFMPTSELADKLNLPKHIVNKLLKADCSTFLISDLEDLLEKIS